MFRSAIPPRLHVLLVGPAGVARQAMTAGLTERKALVLAGPAKTAASARGFGTRFKPEMVRLDFHGLPVSISSTVSFFKALAPPLVLVLTHDVSVTMRRRRREAWVDAVFDKTSDLEAIAALLERTREVICAPVPSPGCSPPSRTPAECWS